MACSSFVDVLGEPDRCLNRVQVQRAKLKLKESLKPVSVENALSFYCVYWSQKTRTLSGGEKGGDGFIGMGFIQLTFNLQLTLLIRRT